MALVKKVVAVSGGFDPLHVGHVRYLKTAKKLGDFLVVILNNDNWLMKKKGYVFMPENDRFEILGSLECVDYVLLSTHSVNDIDTSVSRELAQIKPHIFANGGDRLPGNTPEDLVCKTNNIQMVFGVGGGKIRASSELVKELERKTNG